MVFGSEPARQAAGATTESGTYRLYKFEQPIGDETWRIARDGDAIVLTDTFSFTDRGSVVPLASTFRAAADLTPRSFESKGRSSRFSTVDVSLRVDRDSAMIRQGQQTREEATPKQYFVVNGYSPIAQQMLMLRYWLLHESPAEMPILPQGTTIRILPRGADEVTVGGRRIALTRYSVGGLIWGRETVWLDDARRLVAAVTTDAEFDHFEALAEGYESLIGHFVAEAAATEWLCSRSWRAACAKRRRGRSPSSARAWSTEQVRRRSTTRRLSSTVVALPRSALETLSPYPRARR